MVYAKHLTLGTVLMAVGMGANVARSAEDPVGYWATEKHESQIKVAHCGADGICGTIFWMKDPNDGKGSPKLDRENQDESKRRRTLLGMPLLTMKPDDDHWKGTIYNPQNGKTYSATFKLTGQNEAEVEGCVAYVLCGGQKWTREEPRQVNANTASTHPAQKAAGTPATPDE